MSAFEKLSILIPSYNSAATIRACLDSVLAQETPLPYEVIVADSSDDA
ncbi:MAG: glycosyltransferase, partial [Chloroflexi bacterium]